MKCDICNNEIIGNGHGLAGNGTSRIFCDHCYNMFPKLKNEPPYASLFGIDIIIKRLDTVIELLKEYGKNRNSL